jgi:hypothetical protein
VHNYAPRKEKHMLGRKYGGRKPGTRNRRGRDGLIKIQLEGLSVEELKLIVKKANRLIKINSLIPPTYKVINESFSKVVLLLQGETIKSNLFSKDLSQVVIPKDTILTLELLQTIPMPLLVHIDIGSIEKEFLVAKALKPLRKPQDGKFHDVGPVLKYL